MHPVSVETVNPEGPLGRRLIETAETSDAYQQIFDYLTERHPLVSTGTSISHTDGRYIVKFSLQHEGRSASSSINVVIREGDVVSAEGAITYYNDDRGSTTEHVEYKNGTISPVIVGD
jgi:hypothetical protein